MQMRLYAFMMIALASVTLVAGCPPPGSVEEETVEVVEEEVIPGALTVYTSVPPLADFAKRIGGDRVRVRSVLPAGANPQTYTPSDDQLAAVASADVVFTAGATSFARSVPGGVDVSREANLRSMSSMLVGENRKRFPGKDEYIWMSPESAGAIAKAIYLQYRKSDPEGIDALRRNYEVLYKELNALDGDIQRNLMGTAGQTIFVSSPHFGYFCRQYDLKQQWIDTEDDHPSDDTVKEIIRSAIKSDVRVIVVGPEFSPQTAEHIASSISGIVIPFDPFALEYFDNMRYLARSIGQGAGGGMQ